MYLARIRHRVTSNRRKGIISWEGGDPTIHYYTPLANWGPTLPWLGRQSIIPLTCRLPQNYPLILLLKCIFEKLSFHFTVEVYL
jgi:hypothetical protein